MTVMLRTRVQRCIIVRLKKSGQISILWRELMHAMQATFELLVLGERLRDFRPSLRSFDETSRGGGLMDFCLILFLKSTTSPDLFLDVCSSLTSWRGGLVDFGPIFALKSLIWPDLVFDFLSTLTMLCSRRMGDVTRRSLESLASRDLISSLFLDGLRDPNLAALSSGFLSSSFFLSVLGWEGLCEVRLVDIWRPFASSSFLPSVLLRDGLWEARLDGLSRDLLRDFFSSLFLPAVLWGDGVLDPRPVDLSAGFFESLLLRSILWWEGLREALLLVNLSRDLLRDFLSSPYLAPIGLLDLLRPFFLESSGSRDRARTSLILESRVVGLFDFRFSLNLDFSVRDSLTWSLILSRSEVFTFSLDGLRDRDRFRAFLVESLSRLCKLLKKFK